MQGGTRKLHTEGRGSEDEGAAELTRHFSALASHGYKIYHANETELCVFLFIDIKVTCRYGLTQNRRT